MWGWAAFLMEFSPSHLVFIFLYMVHYKCKEERGGKPLKTLPAAPNPAQLTANQTRK